MKKFPCTVSPKFSHKKEKKRNDKHYEGSQKLGLCADFYSNLAYYARNKMWDFESLKTEAETNGDYDAALEYYKQYIELKKVSKEADDFCNELANKEE